MMLQLPEERLKELGAYITAKEILRQPELWKSVFKEYTAIKAELEQFLEELVEKHSYIRVLFTGAGSSQYVGDVLVKSLVELGDVGRFRFESIGTTDIVSAPQSTLEKDSPTLLVSFGRSGNSPESVAAVNIVDELVENSYHLIITCAKEGELAKKSQEMRNAFCCVLPTEANDQAFAMTGSCSSMILLATLVFSQEDLLEKEAQVDKAAEVVEDLLRRENEIAQYLDENVYRVVYVGSGPLAAVSRELQLKFLELTAGEMSTVFDSSMGLRHGPKSFIDSHTVVFVLRANDAYTRQYDLDLYHELKGDGIAKKVVLIGHDSDEFAYKKAESLKEAYLVFPALVFAQILAINASILIKNRPDTPSASGTVNRVVKGVMIHTLKKTRS